jgi:hypothetical protein
MEVLARNKVKRVQIEATILRADGRIDKLGTISDSSWYWRWGPGRWLSRRRIARANRSLDGE